MKGFAFVLLCALVAVQGRHFGIESTRSVAALGENPWLVHLRIAIATSGLLNTCAGTLIDNRWVLTSASCISDSRFIWIRYGVVNVINPSLVTESSIVRVNPGYNAATGDNNIGLININRNVQSTEYISPAPISFAVSEPSRICAFGQNNDAPGEQLNCYNVGVDVGDNGALVVTSDEFTASRFDVGAPLISDGGLVALLTEAGSEGSVGRFLAVARYIDWINQQTRAALNAEAVPEVAPEAVYFVQ